MIKKFIAIMGIIGAIVVMIAIGILLYNNVLIYYRGLDKQGIKFLVRPYVLIFVALIGWALSIPSWDTWRKKLTI